MSERQLHPGRAREPRGCFLHHAGGDIRGQIGVPPAAPTTVWDIEHKDETGITRHGTQKPVECMERPMRNHGGRGDAIYEPFSGSGSTLIAAERQRRSCYAIELTPAYVQMAIDRWEQYTGLTAQKAGQIS